MQPPDEGFSERPAIRPTRLIRPSQEPTYRDTRQQYDIKGIKDTAKQEDVATLPTSHIPAMSTIPTIPTMPILPQTPAPMWSMLSQNDLAAKFDDEIYGLTSMNTMRLMALSGAIMAVRSPVRRGDSNTLNTMTAAQQGKANSYDDALLGETLLLPHITTTQKAMPTVAGKQSKWRAILNDSRVKVVLGLLIGVAMLFLITRFINIVATVEELQEHLTTTQGIIYALLATASFIGAFSIRGARWRLFLSRICDISTFKSIQIFWVAVFLNFLLPVQGGELGKSLILKRIKHVPISQSLPTVAMDKSLDLMPALFIMAIVPFIPDVHMDAALWIILGLVSSMLIGIICTVAMMAWNRAVTTKLIHAVLRSLPGGIGKKIEGFALGFVDSLLEGASNPKTFIPAILLTSLAITCDGLFAWFAFLTVGVSTMSFGTAIFGYTTYNMFCILPTPPGQVGSNELVGVLVFSGLLNFPKTGVLAMYVFSHPLAALIMTTMCLLCLSGLGISIKSAMKIRSQHSSHQTG